jgi:hypothetical protein
MYSMIIVNFTIVMEDASNNNDLIFFNINYYYL